MKNQWKTWWCTSGLASGRSRRILIEKRRKYKVFFFEFVEQIASKHDQPETLSKINFQNTFSKIRFQNLYKINKH